jgi:phosphoribosylanthranilate isomerase
MAAISYVFTIRRAAQILGRDEDLLWDLSDQLEPEHGKLWVLDIDGGKTLAFSEFGSESLRDHRRSDRSEAMTGELIAPTVRCSPHAYAGTEKVVVGGPRPAPIETPLERRPSLSRGGVQYGTRPRCGDWAERGEQRFIGQRPLRTVMVTPETETMTTKVKICGLKTQVALDAALTGGADYVGLVFFPPSPRSVSPALARVLAGEARGRARIVALAVDPDDALLDTIVGTVAPDLIQLHGEETPERVAEVRRRWGKPVMKAIKVETEQDAHRALDFNWAADLVLFDARAPADSTRPGGNGAAFDWRMLLAIKDDVDYMLSGGLTPDNVAEAIRITGAPIVDVSSGVETSPGEKDPELIRRFLEAAKAV